MIKKTILMLLVLVGEVMSANADNFIITGDAAITKNNHNWYYEDADNLLTETKTLGVYTLVVEGCELQANTNYGFKVKVSENTWNNETTFPGSNYNISVPQGGTYTLIYYVDVNNKSIRVITTPLLRWNLGDNWSAVIDEDALFTKVDDFSWRFEIPAEEFTGDTSFRLFSAVFSKMAYPNGQDVQLIYGGEPVNSAYFNSPESTNWSWRIAKPSYDFEKVVLNATYSPFSNDEFGSWEVSADAYISKTLAFVEDTYIGTFGSAANVDFSKVEGLTAKKLKVSAGTIIEMNATTLFGGEGALLTAESAGPFSIPVAASASADADNNLVAITAKVQLSQEPETGYTAYVLTNKKADGTIGPLAFYKVNSIGTWCAAGTAYLKVAKVGGAPDYIPFGETTGIENVSHEAVINNQYYTLDGRRVAQPTKGLYIVNGKKVIIK